MTATRPKPSPWTQWWVLTRRIIAPTLRNGELLIAIAVPVVFTVSYYVPLRNVMAPYIGGMSSYAQFLMPLITVTAIFFVSMSAALRSATDIGQGINRRFRSMPIGAMTPLSARMSANVFRCAIALMTAVVCGHVIGFRFYGGVGRTIGFCALGMMIGVTLAFVGDLIGTVSKNLDAIPYLYLLPQLTLGLLSVGLQPVELFPGWIQPFVGHQPISAFIYALRVLAGDTTDAAGSPSVKVIGAALLWMLGAAVIAVALYRVVIRRQT
jgi:ABC-2 type transport system permease protein